MQKLTKVKVPTSLAVPIVGDGAIASQVADGRLLPVMILDTRSRPEVDEVIRVSRQLSGDVTHQWATDLDNADGVMLLVKFQRPVAAELLLRFSIEHQAMLVECVLTGEGMYLQSGRPGDRISTTPSAVRMLVELPDSGFREHWDRLLLKRMTVVMARRLGTSRRKARPVAEEFIKEMRKLPSLRVKQYPTSDTPVNAETECGSTPG